MAQTVMFINVLFPGMWPLKVGSEKFDDMIVLSFVGQTRLVSHTISRVPTDQGNQGKI